MVYNITWDNATDTMGDLIVNINNTSGGLIGILLLVAIFIVILFMYKRYDTKVVFMVDSFLCLALSILFWGAGVTNSIPIILFAILLGLGIIYQRTGDD